jgi:anti-sigma B factor antagonist
MEHEVKDEGAFTVVALKGEVDMRCSPVARKAILSAVEKNKPLVVELSGVTYMDSSGVASLVEGLQMAKKRNLGFSLAGTSAPVMSVLKLARLDKVFTLHMTLSDALA